MLIQDVGGQYCKRKEEDEAHANAENSRRMGSINQQAHQGVSGCRNGTGISHQVDDEQYGSCSTDILHACFCAGNADSMVICPLFTLHISSILHRGEDPHAPQVWDFSK